MVETLIVSPSVEVRVLHDFVADELVQSNDFEPDKLDRHESRDHGQAESKVSIPWIPDPEQDTTNDEGNINGWDNLDNVLWFKEGNEDKLGHRS